jgi:hypothetical protein
MLKNLWKKWELFLNMEQVHPHKKHLIHLNFLDAPQTTKQKNMLGIMPSNYTLNFFEQVFKR